MNHLSNGVRSRLGVLAPAALLASAPPASSEQAVETFSFTASDGVALYGTFSGEALRPRPLIGECSPYGLGPGGPPAGPEFSRRTCLTRRAREALRR